MATYVNIDGYQEDKYFARSWAIITREQGWFGQIALLWVVSLVPIIGPLWVLGYLSERGRLVAWGIPTPPQQNNITFSTCVKSGWRAFLVLLGWSLAFGVIVGALEAIPIIGGIIAPIASLISVAVGIITMVAVVRATIYQQVSAGYNVSNIFKMVENDAAGLLRIFGMSLIGGAIIAFVVAIVFAIAFIPSAASFIANTETLARMIENETFAADSNTINLFLEWFEALMTPIIISSLIAAFPNALLSLLSYVAVGLWTRQYNVPAWGNSDDPLPGTAPAYQQYQYPSQAPQAQQPYQQPPAGQVPYGYGDTDYSTQTHSEADQIYKPSSQQRYDPNNPYQTK